MRSLNGSLQSTTIHPPIVPGKEPFIFFNHVSRDYFRTMEMQVRAGRPFNAQDGPKA